MGVEFHITRAENWFENEEVQITAEEWLQYIASDSELKLHTENGEYYAIWLGKSKYEEPWFDWSSGNIYTKWPDTALYRKMLQIAEKLNAKVQDDDVTVYLSADDWEFDPTLPAEAISNKPIQNISWWQKLFKRFV
jgi:hypothetical protein